MTLAELKEANGIVNFNLYECESGRFIGSENGIKVCTTEDFKPKKAAFVYLASDKFQGPDKQGNVNTMYWVTNKEKRAGDLIL